MEPRETVEAVRVAIAERATLPEVEEWIGSPLDEWTLSDVDLVAQRLRCRAFDLLLA